jgi:thioredoxin-related protein
MTSKTKGYITGLSAPWALACLIVLLAVTTAWSAEDRETGMKLVEAVDLQMDAGEARRDGKVILLLVSQTYCPFCVQIKQQILFPMLLAGDFREELMIRELLIDAGMDVVDFQGNSRSGSALAADYGARLTPTMLFLDPQGEELAKPLVGIYTPEMFYYYVEESIRQAIDALPRTSR